MMNAREMNELAFYDVLSLSQNCSQHDVRTSFKQCLIRVLGKDDKGFDKLVMHKISEAFEVLADPTLRAIYDAYGKDGLTHAMPERRFKGFRYHGNPEITLQTFLKTENIHSGIADWNSVQFQEYTNKKDSTVQPLVISLQEAYSGTIKNHFSNLQLQSIHVPQAVHDGMLLACNDTTYQIAISAHEHFARIGDDLLFNQTISLEEALHGTVVNISTLDQRHLKVPVHRIINPTSFVRINNEGMPKFNVAGKGDLIIAFTIQFPSIE